MGNNKDNHIHQDFFSLYLKYTTKTECPTFFHRWTAIASLAAWLGRGVWFNHGHFTLYPNLYCMLIGSPGTKKSSAIKIGAKLLKQAGYTTFAARKTRQEKFLLDLAEQSAAPETDILEENLFGEEQDNYENKPPSEVFVAADEFNNFIGVGNLEFMSILGELWDYEGVYDYKLKNSKSVFIPHPTISILGGNTPTGFSQAFPNEAIGQGFFSRLLLVYGEPSGVKYTFPPQPDDATKALLISLLHEIKAKVVGEMTISDEAIELLDAIYHTWEGIDDVRFEHYTNRRLTHLIKLTLVVAASRISSQIKACDVIYANTILSFTETLMPKALGEFGKARNSDVAHKIMQLIDGAKAPLSMQTIWKHVHSELDRREQMLDILGNLTLAEKIQIVKGGYLPIKKVLNEEENGTVDWSILTDTERKLV